MLHVKQLFSSELLVEGHEGGDTFWFGVEAAPEAIGLHYRPVVGKVAWAAFLCSLSFSIPHLRRYSIPIR